MTIKDCRPSTAGPDGRETAHRSPPHPELPMTSIQPLLRRAALLALAVPWSLLQAVPVAVKVDPMQIHGGQTCQAWATTTGGQVRSWVWTLEDGAGAGTLAPLPGNRCAFTAPEVETHIVIRLRATDPAEPETTGVVGIQVSPPLVLRTEPAAPLTSGGTCALVAHRGGLAWAGEWHVLEPGGGTIRRDPDGKSHFQAPLVELPSVFTLVCVDPAFPHWRDHQARLEVQVQPAAHLQAVNRGSATRTLVSGDACRLTATLASHPDGTPPAAWVWSEARPRGGHFFHEDGQTCYRAPRVNAATTVYLRAADQAHPGVTALLPLHILPHIPGLSAAVDDHATDFIATTLMPHGYRADWMEPSGMTLLAGALQDGPEQLQGVQAAAWVPGDPAAETPLRRQGHWLVGGEHGLAEVTRAGQVVPLDSRRVAALAVRPPGQDRPQQLAIVDELRPSSNITNPRIWVRDGLAGPFRYLAGGTAPTPGLNARYLTDGQGPQAQFGKISALAYGPDGLLYALDDRAKSVRRVSPGGEVTTLAGHRDGVEGDGPGPQVKLGHLHGLAFAPDGDTLYLATGPTLRTLSLSSGRVGTLLGEGRYDGGNLRDSEPPTAAMAPGVPCLDAPQGLFLLGGRLVFEDAGTLRAFHLAGRHLNTLMGYQAPGELAHHVQARMGPLHRFHPLLPLSSCASLGQGHLLAHDGAGTALVAGPGWLATVDLSRMLRTPGAEAPRDQPKAER